MPEIYSPELSQYVGSIELTANQKMDALDRYMVFRDALTKLSSESLSVDDKVRARSFLERKAEVSRPRNIGYASGDTGEADYFLPPLNLNPNV